MASDAETYEVVVTLSSSVAQLADVVDFERTRLIVDTFTVTTFPRTLAAPAVTLNDSRPDLLPGCPAIRQGRDTATR